MVPATDAEYLFRNADGTFAYVTIYELNASSENGSLMTMSNSVNRHNWYGLMSTYTLLSENILMLTFTGVLIPAIIMVRTPINW